MQLELPKFYKFSASGDSVDVDDSADLILHRFKIKLGLSGPIDFDVDITGIPKWSNNSSVTYPYQYLLNSVNMLPQSTHTIPIFQRNENLNVSIKSSTPFPVSLLGMEWEGKYNRRFYRRG